MPTSLPWPTAPRRSPSHASSTILACTRQPHALPPRRPWPLRRSSHRRTLPRLADSDLVDVSCLSSPTQVDHPGLVMPRTRHVISTSRATPSQCGSTTLPLPSLPPTRRQTLPPRPLPPPHWPDLPSSTSLAKPRLTMTRPASPHRPPMPNRASPALADDSSRAKPSLVDKPTHAHTIP